MPIETVQQNIRKILRRYAVQGQHLYAILEGTGKRDDLRKRLLTNSDLSVFPLYFDTDFDNMLHISPLCVSVSWESSFLDWLLDEGLAKHPGILACSASDTRATRQHFQSLLEVILPDLNLALFRFYDPVVLHRYIYAVQGEALARFMGPLVAYCWAQNAPAVDTNWHYIDQKFGEKSLEDFTINHIRVTEEEMKYFELAQEYEFAARLCTHFA